MLISHLDFRVFSSLHIPVYILAVGSLLLPFVFGAASRGAHRWLQFGNVSLQPSELIKPFLLITFCVLAFTELQHRILWLVGVFLLPALVIFLQPDLGTSLVVGVGWLTIFLTQVRFRWLAIGLLILLILSPLGWWSLKSYQRDRLLTFIDPYHDPLGNGYHVIQSVIAVGSGEFVGRGLGQGTQSQLRFLPERHTDFILASLSEDLGFVGVVLVIGLLLLVFWRIRQMYRIFPRKISVNFFGNERINRGHKLH